MQLFTTGLLASLKSICLSYHMQLLKNKKIKSLLEKFISTNILKIYCSVIYQSSVDFECV